MIDWSRYQSWAIAKQDRGFIAKVQDTVVQSYVVKSTRDSNVTFDVLGTPNNKTVGYALMTRGRPIALLLTHSLGLFYSDAVDTSPRRIEAVLYHDSNTRLLAFGPEATRDYLWVLRKR